MAEKDKKEPDDEEWEEEVDEDDEDDEADADDPKAKRNRLLIKIVAVLCVLVVVGGAYLVLKMLGVTEAVLGKPNITEVTLNLGKPVTHTLPEVRTDLKRTGRKAQFIKMVIIAQLNEKDLPGLTNATKQAEIVDGIKTHLRSLEFRDLQGKAGSERLRFELLQVINNKLAPASAHTILFKDLLIQ
ncbi:MAG: flagellar basal body-associated FliL family protein [Rhodospirillaceae bacterium]